MPLPSLAFLLLLLLLLLLPFSPAQGQPPPSQAAALLSLKSSWSDPSNSLSSWTPPTSSPCLWRGVSCSNDGTAVTALRLPHHSLGGPLPPSIADLPSLQFLDLSSNRLTGRIPEELGYLTSLRVLRLRFNQFNGSIPATIYGLSFLRQLLLENNNLTGSISPSISNLFRLVYFSFASNALSDAFPASFTSLTRLESLYGAHNNLSGEIPVSIHNLRSLLYFNMQENWLTGGIPSSIGSLSMLKVLNLRHNFLSGSLPPELEGLGSLVNLDLSSNGFNGSIPSELGNLSALETLYLEQNNFSGSIDPSLGKLAMLKSLNLSYNNLSGTIPTNGALGNFSADCFEGNRFLCGWPLVEVSCSSPPQPTLLPPSSPQQTPSQASKTQNASSRWKVTVGVVVGALPVSAIFLCTAFLMWRRKQKDAKQVQNRSVENMSTSSYRVKFEMFVERFTFNYENIVSHAGYYDTAHVLGKGRFATVYRSDLPEYCLAVKVFKHPISQSAFEKEVEGLESASHADTLLPIKGYLSSGDEKAIFYDYIPKGNLYDLLHNNPDASMQLDWSKRLSIASGIAQALAHLHRGSNIRVLHKDVKTTNVLLDDNLNPLVTDYGLIGLVSKSIVETPGYIPPELNVIKKYTEKSDVYSFGIVLLELLTGKKPISYIGDRQLNLATWVLRLHKDKRGSEVFCSNLVESCPYPDYPDKVLNLAVLCLSEVPAHRPTMSETAIILEDLGGLNSPLRSPCFRQDKPLLFAV